MLLDVVPNHMATSDENRFWRDPELRRRFFDWDEETGWYRRFFDIGELGGVRVEDPEVFATTHGKVLELVRDGLVEGLRIDHPDGLADPRGYLERLAAEGVEHVWVEKILEPGERLRDWPVEGTTGYEFANDVTALFVDPAGEEPLTRLYEELTGERRPFAAVADEAKLEQARTTFQPELERLRRARRPSGARGGGCVAPRLPHLRRAVVADGSSRTTARRSPRCRRTCGACCCSRRTRRPSSSRASSRRPGR